VDLAGVPETLLWNLYQRAGEARRPDGVLDDPRAVDLVDRLDYPFEDRFGPAGLVQWQALRSRTFDRAVRDFAAANPGGTVVSLGEGLETQFWRVDDGRLRWVTVDLPEVVRLRRELLGEPGPRQRLFAGSAFDAGWIRTVDTSRGVLVIAQGMLMYFPRPQVHRLVVTCAEAFPGARLVLDGVPAWFSARTLAGRMRTRRGYVAPPMPWFLDTREKRALSALHPRIREVRDLNPPPGRGLLFGAVFPALHLLPRLRGRGIGGMPVVRVDIAGD
jgi:O-methyltransferase involved in polyketide biosynthesis